MHWISCREQETLGKFVLYEAFLLLIFIRKMCGVGSSQNRKISRNQHWHFDTNFASHTKPRKLPLGLQKLSNMAVRNILSKQDLPISDAVKEFMRPFNDAVDSGDGAVEEALWQSWSDLIKYSATIPHSEQGRLVQFMQELRKEQSPKKQNEESCKIWGETLEWKTLPLFGPSLRESWNNGEHEISSEECYNATN
jgi:hypothetical protein